MPLSAGGKLGPYEIVAPLGAGGMGEVYRAHDTRLSRDVALKILPEDLANDPSRRARFEQEARAVAALNHPNIVAVYDVGDGYIVSELIDGEPLRSVKLSVRKTIEVAVQIASGLAAAHDAGIVHRDLKPDNILLTRDGRPKILDFGLAKVTSPRAAAGDNTVTVHTEAGVVMGTPGYMSPEQVRGLATDHRSDIFSFGAILHELLSGKRAFHGETSVDTMQAILRQEAPELSETVPAGLRQIVAHCLEKAPEDRFQSARDLSFSLAALAQSGSHTSLAPVRSMRRRWFFAPIVAGLVTAFVSVAASWFYWRPEPPPPFDILTRVTTDPGLTTDPAFSPDGKMIAYASNRSGDGSLDVWIQQLANGEAVRLTNDPSDDRQPAFSPDGSTIVFRSDRDHGGIYTIPSLGGVARLLVTEGYDPQYSPDGQSIAYWTGYTGTAFPARGWIYSVNGRTQQQILPDFARVSHPIWSPDGKSLMFEGSPKLGQIAGSPELDWWITPVVAGSAAVRTGAREYLNKQGLQFPKAAAWLPSNEILSSASAGNAVNIWRIPVSRTLRVDRRPVRVTMGTQGEVHPTATRDSMVAYAAENSASEIWGLDLNPDAAGGNHDLVRLVGSTATNIRPSISRDGHTMAYISNTKSGPHVWIKSLTSGSDRALTGGSRPEYWPVLSPDGTKVAFTTAQYPTAEEWRAGVPLLVAEVRTGVPQAVCPNCYRPDDWSADGRKLLICERPSSDSGIAEFDLAARKSTILIRDSHHDVTSPRYSPDGRWVSFHERTSPDTRQLWIAPLDEAALPVPPARWIAISDNTTVDREARWSEDGTWLYFASNRDGFQCLWAQRLDPSSKRPTGPAVPIHHFHSALLGLTLQDSGLFGMSVGAGRMLVSLGATTGNIWLMRRP